MKTKLLAVGDVHRDFKAKAHFGEFRFGPHGLAPQELVVGSTAVKVDQRNIQPTRCIVLRSATLEPAQYAELGLMIFIRSCFVEAPQCREYTASHNHGSSRPARIAMSASSAEFEAPSFCLML